jgi:hypothetical protein
MLSGLRSALLRDEATRVPFPYSLKQCIVLENVRMDVHCEHGIHIGCLFARGSRGSLRSALNLQSRMSTCMRGD